MFNDKILKSVAEAVKEVLQQEALKGQQHKIDKNKNNKIDAHDFKILRGEKSSMKKEEAENVEESNNPFDLKNYKSQLPTKPGEKAGFDSKKVSTGTVYTRKPVKDDKPMKEEASNDEFHAEAEKARKKSLGQEKAEVAKPAVSAVKQESVEQIDESDLGNGYKIKMKHIDKGRIHSPSGEHVADVTRHKSGWQYHSGNSKWDGTEESPHYKTGVEKTKMAAARKAAQIHMKEEVEQIDELSKDTLTSYALKAGKSLGGQVANIGNAKQISKFYADKTSAKEVKKDAIHTAGKRMFGLGRASSRLAKEEIEQIDERHMTEPEMKKREKIVKSMKKGMQGFKDRYGDRAKNVMYATATKQAMKD